MFLSLAAYDGGYMTTEDAHNTVDVTVECQMHVGGLCYLLSVRQTSAPAILLVEACKGFYHVPGMVKAGAHNTVDAQGHVGGLTVWELMAPTIL